MSDISIPGVNSRFNTSKMVDDLVKVEKVRLTRMQEESKALENNKKAWQDLNRLLGTLRTTSRNLFSFENPFAERSASSSDPSLSVSATREASEGTTKLQVLQLASADRFASAPLKKDQEIAAGNYTFGVGSETISLRYRGGSVKDFAEALTRRGEGFLKASIIQNRPDSQILLIESLKTGEDWGLQFKDDALGLGKSLGFVEEEKGNSVTLPPSSFASVKSADPGQKSLPVKDGIASVGPGTSFSIPLPADFKVEPEMLLEYKVRARSLSEEEWRAPSKPEGPVLKPSPDVRVADAALSDEPSAILLPEWTPPTPPERVVKDNVLSLKGGSSSYNLPDVRDSEEFVTVRVELGKEMPDAKSIEVDNQNTYRILELGDVKIFDPRSKGNYLAKNAVSNAQNAKISLEGITIERSENVIDDAIPGVTLTLNSVSKDPAFVKVEPDRKLVKDKLIEFVAQYNAVVREINILSARKGTTDVVDEISFFTDDEKSKALERLGMYQGDSTLSLIKSRMQTFAGNAYPTREGNSLAVLGHIGISTNASQAGAGAVSSSRLRGYLEINERTLDKALAEHFLAVKELFGNDTNGDLVVDSGFGVQLDNYFLPYVQTGGILAGKTNTLDSQIKQKGEQIKNYEVYLADYEADLKLKYGRMEGAVNQLEASSRDIQGLNQNNSK